jgi:hypothetical protein
MTNINSLVELASTDRRRLLLRPLCDADSSVDGDDPGRLG